MNTNYTPIIGLEIHVELKTASKMFCGCSANYFREEPNTLTCPVCLGLPGALPVPNQKAIDWTILLGLALDCTIARETKFDRKNYFYPDLPKGYQISQYDEPIATNGKLTFDVNGSPKTVRIRRVHLEEDTGKLQHAVVKGKQVSLVDFNRSGVPLVEIVTEPDIHSGEEAVAYMKSLHGIVRTLGISDANMEEGSMRIEPNISVLKILNSNNQVPNSKLELPEYKIEVKNINSFNFAKKAIAYEIDRHIQLLEAGETPKQENRGRSEDKKMTISQRSKEEAADYRYFPEPDIPPLVFSDEYVESIRSHLSTKQLPSQVEDNLISNWKIRKQYAHYIAATAALSSFFIEAAELGKQGSISPELIAGTIVNKKPDIEKVTPEQLVNELKKKQSSVVSDDKQLEDWVDKALHDNPQVVADIKSGKQQAIGVLVGAVMRLSKGTADAKKIKPLVSRLVREIQNHP